MERAAQALVQWFLKTFPDLQQPVLVVCGPGNNGGDGLAIARLLHQRFYAVTVWYAALTPQRSADAQTNWERLPEPALLPRLELTPEAAYPPLPSTGVLFDALLGSGANRPLAPYWASLIDHLQTFKGLKIAVDLPTGVGGDGELAPTAFRADHTFGFERPKLAYLLPDTGVKVGRWHLGRIGLDAQALAALATPFHYLTPELAASWYRPRERFSHKGTYGHALLIAGSQGMMGAAVLSARACLRSGVGLLSVHSPQCGYLVLQEAVPEAMVSTDPHQFQVSSIPSLEPYAAIGMGCGLGQKASTLMALDQLLATKLPPLVLDADALNLIAAAGWRDRLPVGSILTPHPKEFARLFGASGSSVEQLARLRQAAQHHQCYILLKGAHSVVATPTGECFFNSTGNPGMATAGSGDVLTGIITSLLAQGYPAPHAAALGMFLHGRAGDLALAQQSAESLVASDLINHLGPAFRSLVNPEGPALMG